MRRQMQLGAHEIGKCGKLAFDGRDRYIGNMPGERWPPVGIQGDRTLSPAFLLIDRMDVGNARRESHIEATLDEHVQLVPVHQS